MEGRALVVGAGIGGLAVARLLRDRGFEVEVLERTSQIAPQGAGITLWPNATKVLRKLGVDDALLKPPMPRLGILRRWDGRALVSTDVGELERRHGAPMVCLQRTTLHEALLSDGVGDLVRLGAEVSSIEETPNGVRALARSGERFEADVLIGADGVRSIVRDSLLGDGPPISRGIFAYRAVIDASPGDVGMGLGMGEYWGPGRVFGLAPVDGDRLFWLATKRAPSGEPEEPNPIPALLERHRGWAPEIARVIEATEPEQVIRHELFDRKPAKRWTGERTALLGDAAHPMLPFLGQGACQALEDADMLARLLDSGAPVSAALDKYQRTRRRRVARITLQSRRITRIAHLRSPALRTVRDRAFSLMPERALLHQASRIVEGAS